VRAKAKEQAEAAWQAELTARTARATIDKHAEALAEEERQKRSLEQKATFEAKQQSRLTQVQADVKSRNEVEAQARAKAAEGQKLAWEKELEARAAKAAIDTAAEAAAEAERQQRQAAYSAKWAQELEERLKLQKIDTEAEAAAEAERVRRAAEVLERSREEAEAYAVQVKAEMAARDALEAEAREKLRQAEAAAWEAEQQVRIEQNQAMLQALNSGDAEWSKHIDEGRAAAAREQEARYALALAAAQARELELKASLKELQLAHAAAVERQQEQRRAQGMAEKEALVAAQMEAEAAHEASRRSTETEGYRARKQREHRLNGKSGCPGMLAILQETFGGDEDAACTEAVLKAVMRFVVEHEIKAATEIRKFKLTDEFAAVLPGLDTVGKMQLASALEKATLQKTQVSSALYGQRGVR